MAYSAWLGSPIVVRKYRIPDIYDHISRDYCYSGPEPLLNYRNGSNYVNTRSSAGIYTMPLRNTFTVDRIGLCKSANQFPSQFLKRNDCINY